MKIGLIGYGFMGGAHLAAMATLPDVTLTAVACRTRPSADGSKRGNLDLKAGPLPDSVKWHPDWQAIVRDPAIEAVDICLPTHLHREVVLSAFEHGKNVLCEKPMALTSADCSELLEAAETAGRTFMVAQVLRFMAPYRYAAGFVESAGRDAVERCTLRRSTGFPRWSEWLAQPASSGGAILDLLSHDLDQALSWFGQPLSVRAVSIGEVDTARASLLYSNGMTVVVEGGWLAPEVPFSAGFEIATGQSSLTFRQGKLHRTDDGEVEEIVIPPRDPYADEIAYFAACCRSGAPPDLCPPVESANAVRLATLLQRSRDRNGEEMAWT